MRSKLNANYAKVLRLLAHVLMSVSLIKQAIICVLVNGCSWQCKSLRQLGVQILVCGII